VVSQEGKRLRFRLDVDAVPSLLVEMAGDGLTDGMARTDVDIETVSLVLENPFEHHILEVLSVGNHGRLLGVLAE